MSELYNVILEEQETLITFTRTGKEAIIYTSDTTQTTKYDKLCEESPEFYQLKKIDTIKGKICGKTYKLMDKTMISARSKKRACNFTEEQRKEIGERMRANNPLIKS